MFPSYKLIDTLPTVKQPFGKPPNPSILNTPMISHAIYRDTCTNGGTGRLTGDVHFNAAIDAWSLGGFDDLWQKKPTSVVSSITGEYGILRIAYILGSLMGRVKNLELLIEINGHSTKLFRIHGSSFQESLRLPQVLLRRLFFQFGNQHLIFS